MQRGKKLYFIEAKSSCPRQIAGSIPTGEKERKLLAYQKFVQHETSALNRIFTNNGIDNTLIYTDKDYVKPLMQLFKKRESKR